MKELTNSVKDILENLDSATKKIASNRHYRFATFTVHHGSSVSDQLEERRAHSKTGITARGGDFPHITDAALKKATANSQEVPEGKVTQYFCYVNNSNKGVVVASCTFPRQFLIGDRRTSTTRHPDMARLNKFETESIRGYAKYLESDLAILQDLLEVGFEDDLLKENIVPLGIEMVTRSVTDLDSSHGILVRLERRSIPFPVYCPECLGTLLQALELSVQREIPIDPQILPPIPETSFKLNVYCTENMHRKHGFNECIDFMKVHDKLNAYRTSMGANPHSYFVLDTINKELSLRFGKWVWLEIE